MREILPQPHIEILVRERARNSEPAGDKSVRRRETAVPAPDVNPVLTTKIQQPRPLYSKEIREIRNPVGNYARLFIVGGMSWNRECVGKSKCLPLFIESLELSLRESKRDAGAPTERFERRTAIWLIQLH